MHIMYLDHTLPSLGPHIPHTGPFPIFMSPSFFFPHNQLSSTSAICMGMGPSSALWAIYNWPYLWKKRLCHSSHKLPISYSAGMGSWEPLPCLCQNADWLHLMRSCAVDHNCYEFVSSTSVSYPENSISQLSSSFFSSYYYYYFCPLNPWCSQGEVDKDVSQRADNSAALILRTLTRQGSMTWARCRRNFFDQD